MLIPKTIEDIKALIAQGQQEGLNLEYKGAAALGTSDGKKNEIAKDVSAMANSDGGIIIYGVREFDEVNKKHLPEGVDPVIRAGFTKEQLEQIIQSNIRPKIEGLKIYPISLLDPDHVIYIVEIPQSTTCHQAKDKKYYKRHNFESVPMEHYEILDVLNRAKHPSIDLEFFMIKDESKIILQFYPINAGVIIAHHINYVVQIQSDVLNFKESCLSTKSISENSKIEYPTASFTKTPISVTSTPGSYLSSASTSVFSSRSVFLKSLFIFDFSSCWLIYESCRSFFHHH